MRKNLAKETIMVEKFHSVVNLRNATVRKHCDRIAREILRILEVWKSLKAADLDLLDFETKYEAEGSDVRFAPVVISEKGARIISWTPYGYCRKGETYLKETPQGWCLMRVPWSDCEDEEVFTVEEILKYSVPRIRRAWREWLDRRVAHTEAEAQKALEAL